MKLHVLLLVITCAIGCSHSRSSENPVSTMGLFETTNGRELTDRAVTQANLLLGPDAKITLRTSWTPEKPGNGNPTATIYLVNATGAPPLYMVVVPSDCSCILVQPQRYTAWIEQHSASLSSMLPVESENVLAFMLLHEVGHILNGDHGEFTDQGGERNTSLTKEREERADSFAVEQLLAAAKRTKDTGAWLTAMHVEMDLANLSWNVQARRQDEYFGSVVLRTPAAFADMDYTHPNFELRMLTVNNQIAHTETSRKLLEAFLANRIHQNNSVLFKK